MPILPIKEFMAIMRVTDDLLPTIMVPALILQSTEDHVVTTSSRPGTAHIYWRSSAAKTKRAGLARELLPRRHAGQRRSPHSREDCCSVYTRSQRMSTKRRF